MAKILSRGKVTIARPKKGQRIVRVEAEVLVIEKIAKIASPAKIRRAFRGIENDVKREISKSIVRSYNASGLKKRSKKLLATATDNYDVKIQLKGRRKIVITGRWKVPKIDYFFIHLFGGVIEPVQAKALRFKIRNKVIFAQRVEIPKRPYIKLDRQAMNKIVALLEKALGQSLKKNPPEQISEESNLKGKSKFKIRRALRKKGKSSSEARRRANELARK